jgi:hypothetical protein
LVGTGRIAAAITTCITAAYVATARVSAIIDVVRRKITGVVVCVAIVGPEIRSGRELAYGDFAHSRGEF